jgi:peptidoglycan/xylan/chitin deacetylase (PgdA/CDA1 family)
MNNKIAILLYHDLSSPECINEKTGDATRDTVLLSDGFDAQLAYLSDKGYNSISLSEYFHIRENNASIPDNNIIITFDDGHTSNYHLAFPILKKYGFKATFFIIADRIDKEFHLTGKQIVEMIDAGMEIGSHGYSHKFLPLMNYRDIVKELGASREILEEVIDRPVNYFAYPGGHYNGCVLKALAQAGYTGACSCLQGMNGMNENPFLLKRIEIRKGFSAQDFDTAFNSLNLTFYRFVDFWKQMLRKSVGLERYARLRSRFYKFYIFRR